VACVAPRGLAPYAFRDRAGGETNAAAQTPAPPWERCQQWRTNLEAPRLDVRDLAPTEIRALENYGVVRLEPDELSGSYVRVDD
jgi:hypothetical protein